MIITTVIKQALLLLPLIAAKPQVAETMHPFYVSVTELQQNKQEKSIEISFKFFTDDFEQAVNKYSGTSFDIGKDKTSFDKLIQTYIKKHFIIAADGKTVGLNYVGYETEKESVYCYFEILNLPAVKKIDINNNLLHDLSSDQVNIIHANINGKRQSTRLNFPETKASFQF